jgi:hypothetical protein
MDSQTVLNQRRPCFTQPTVCGYLLLCCYQRREESMLKDSFKLSLSVYLVFLFPIITDLSPTGMFAYQGPTTPGTVSKG